MDQQVIITIADFLRLKRMIRRMRQSGRRGAYVNALERELRRAAVVPTDQVPPDTVTMNSRVRIRELHRKVRDTVTVVYPHHADPDEGHVPVVASFGTALLGTRVGDVVYRRDAAGIRPWEIERILYQPESAGDHHL